MGGAGQKIGFQKNIFCVQQLFSFWLIFGWWWVYFILALKAN